MCAQITHARSLLVRFPYLASLPIWSNQRSKGTTCSASGAAATEGTATTAGASCNEEVDEEEDEEEDIDADADDADKREAEEEADEDEDEDEDDEEEQRQDASRCLPGPCVLFNSIPFEAVGPRPYRIRSYGSLSIIHSTGRRSRSIHSQSSL